MLTLDGCINCSVMFPCDVQCAEGDGIDESEGGDSGEVPWAVNKATPGFHVLYTLMERCLAEVPKDRPSMDDIVRTLVRHQVRQACCSERRRSL